MLHPPIRDAGRIAQPMLKNSINLYGEAVMRLNAAKGTVPTNDAAIEGLRARMTAWGIPADAWQIIDGSGLSRRNAIAAEGARGDPSADIRPVGRFTLDDSAAGGGARRDAGGTDDGDAGGGQPASEDRDDVEHPHAGRLRPDARR